jgi:hypothetical protein
VAEAPSMTSGFPVSGVPVSGLTSHKSLIVAIDVTPASASTVIIIREHLCASVAKFCAPLIDRNAGVGRDEAYRPEIPRPAYAEASSDKLARKDKERK